MYKIKLILENGIEVIIGDVEDDEVKITKVQMKRKLLDTICIRTASECIYVVKKDIELIVYLKDLIDSPKVPTVNGGLYA